MNSVRYFPQKFSRANTRFSLHDSLICCIQTNTI